MEVRFSLTPKDVYYYHRFGYRHLLWFQLLALVILASAVFVAVMWLLLPVPTLAHVPLLLRLPVLLVLPLLIALYKPLVLWKAGVIPELKGEHRLLLGPTGCSYQSWRGDLSIPWYWVTATLQDEHSLYFILRSAGPLYQYRFLGPRNVATVLLDRVCIIPKRAFASPLEADAFLDQARMLRGNALPTQPDTSFDKRVA